MKQDRLFYRVCNINSLQGLWYNWDGEFTGLIHNKFNFCGSSNLQMPFDESVVGWLSATDTLENLWKWFTKEEVFKLQSYGYYVYAFKVTDYKVHNNHQLISQTTSEPFLRIEISSKYEIGNIVQLKKIHSEW